MALTSIFHITKLRQVLSLSVILLVLSIVSNLSSESDINTIAKGSLFSRGFSNTNKWATKSLQDIRERVNHSQSRPQEKIRNILSDQNRTWKDVRILCFIPTANKLLDTRARFVRDTWGKRCTKTLYVTEEYNATFPTTVITTDTLGYKKLWRKVRATFIYLYENYFNEYDWFMKADDDTYVVFENLQKFLFTKDSDNDLVYYGDPISRYLPGGHNSGGAGYVLGRAALKRLVEIALKNESLPFEICANHTHDRAEDCQIAKCLHHAGIATVNRTVVRGRLGNSLFRGFSGTGKLLNAPKILAKIRDDEFYKMYVKGTTNNQSISFHSVKGADQQRMDDFFYGPMNDGTYSTHISDNTPQS